MSLNVSQPLPPLPGPRKLHSEFWPVSSPPFRDDVPPPWQEQIEHWQRHESARAETALTPALGRKAERVALANGDVRRLLAGKRYVAIGVGLRKLLDRPASKPDTLLFVFYNYTDDVAIMVNLDLHAKGVQKVSLSRSQPTAAEVEIEQAIALARNDGRIANQLTSELEGNALLAKGVDCYDRSATQPEYYHRIFEVSFRHPAERGPRYQALVDLSTKTVLSTQTLVELDEPVTED